MSGSSAGRSAGEAEVARDASPTGQLWRDQGLGTCPSPATNDQVRSLARVVQSKSKMKSEILSGAWSCVFMA